MCSTHCGSMNQTWVRVGNLAIQALYSKGLVGVPIRALWKELKDHNRSWEYTEQISQGAVISFISLTLLGVLPRFWQKWQTQGKVMTQLGLDPGTYCFHDSWYNYWATEMGQWKGQKFLMCIFVIHIVENMRQSTGCAEGSLTPKPA